MLQWQSLGRRWRRSRLSSQILKRYHLCTCSIKAGRVVAKQRSRQPKCRASLRPLQEQVKQAEAELVKAKAEEAAALQAETEARQKMHIEEKSAATSLSIQAVDSTAQRLHYGVAEGWWATHGRPAELGIVSASVRGYGIPSAGCWCVTSCHCVLASINCTSSGYTAGQPVHRSIPECFACQPQSASTNPDAGQSVGECRCGPRRRRHVMRCSWLAVYLRCMSLRACSLHKKTCSMHCLRPVSLRCMSLSLCEHAACHYAMWLFEDHAQGVNAFFHHHYTSYLCSMLRSPANPWPATATAGVAMHCLQ